MKILHLCCISIAVRQAVETQTVTGRISFLVLIKNYRISWIFQKCIFQFIFNCTSTYLRMNCCWFPLACVTQLKGLQTFSKFDLALSWQMVTVKFFQAISWVEWMVNKPAFRGPSLSSSSRLWCGWGSSPPNSFHWLVDIKEHRAQAGI